MPSLSYHSRGIALLTTLLVVSIVSIISVSMIKRQRIDIRKTHNIQRMEQSWLYAHAVDAWARGQLYKDGKQNSIDSEHDNWHNSIELTMIEEGQITAAISDYQGKFNVNNLLSPGNIGQISLARLRRLFSILNVPQELIDPLLDWLDEDSKIHYPSGAEENHYTGKIPAYRPANRAMTDISELRLVHGFTNEIFRTIEPYLSALPMGVNINVNTASEPILRSLGKDITQQDAEAIINARDEQPFADAESFLKHEALAGRKIKADGLAVSSQYFVADSGVQIGYLNLRYRSILFRENVDNIIVVQRTKRGFFDEQ